MQFNEKLIKLRKEQGLSQEALADKLGVSRQSVSKWESGNTYPEMDKLLALCKIFDCTLEYLTNEEITETETKGEQDPKKIVTNFLDEVVLMIEKSINMFKNMSKPELRNFIIEMAILIMLILIISFPYRALINFPVAIFHGIGHWQIIGGIGSLWFMLTEMAYVIVATTVVFYFYKTRFLDKFEGGPAKTEIREAVEEIKDEVNQIDVPSKKEIAPVVERTSSIITALGQICLIFIKFIVFWIMFGFLMAVVGAAVALAINIYLMTQGVVFVGALIVLVATIALLGTLIDVMFRFIANIKQKALATVISLLVCCVAIGIGSGVVAIEATRIEYIEGVPNTARFEIIEESISFNSDLVFDKNSFFHNGNVEYEVDNSLGNEIKIKIEHIADYTSPELYIDSQNNFISVHTNRVHQHFNGSMRNLIMNGLRENRIYSLSMLYQINVTIIGSERNIEQLKNNWEEYLAKQLEQERYETIIHNELSEYRERFYNLENRYNMLQDNSRDELENCQARLNEVNQSLRDLIRN